MKQDIESICMAYNLGTVKNWVIANYKIKGFKIAYFETENGNFDYIYKI